MLTLRLEIPVTGTQTVHVEGETLGDIADAIVDQDDERCSWGYVDVAGVDCSRDDIMNVLADMVSQGEIPATD